jgi:hypothetical protein
MQPSDSPDSLTPGPIPQAAAARDVAIFFDLVTRDGRRAVEIRTVSSQENAYYAPARATVYSCAYSTQAERNLALRRARGFCEACSHNVVHMGSAEEHRAAWQ